MFDDQEKISNTFIQHVSTTLDGSISGSEIIKLSVQYALDSDVEIPYNTQKEIPAKRIALYENIEALNGRQQYAFIKALCDRFPLSDEKKRIKTKLISKYSHLHESDNAVVNEILIVEAKHWLEGYSKALGLYNDALSKYELGDFNRNLLDDLRLSLEELLRDIFQNSKTLEKQKSFVGQFISDKGGSKELSNMFVTLLNYYTHYQNSYVKHHGDSVIEEEIEFVLEITSSFMKHLVRLVQRD